MFWSFAGVFTVELKLIVCDTRLDSSQRHVKMSAVYSRRDVVGMNAFWQARHCSLVNHSRHLHTHHTHSITSSSSSSMFDNAYIFMFVGILFHSIHKLTTVWVKKIPSLTTCGNFSKTVGNFSTKFYVPIMRSHLRYTTNFYSIICNFDEVMPY